MIPKWTLLNCLLIEMTNCDINDFRRLNSSAETPEELSINIPMSMPLLTCVVGRGGVVAEFSASATLKHKAFSKSFLQNLVYPLSLWSLATIPDKRVGTRSKFYPPSPLRYFPTLIRGERGIRDTAQVFQLLLAGIAIPDKRVETRSKFSPPTTFNVDNQVIFPFLLEKKRYFPTLIRGEGGYVIQLKCPNYFWRGL